MTKKALCVGCNYPRSHMQLQACVVDCHDHAMLALECFGVPRSNIKVLADVGVPGFSAASPTKDNILAEIKHLVKGAVSGDKLFFSFSGHGTQVRDADSDERDGYDEAIVPGDYPQKRRLITDDELYHYMVQPLADGVCLTCVFDSCHSGTILDLSACLDGASMRRAKAGKQKYSLATLPYDKDGCRGIPAVRDYVREELPQLKANSKGRPSIFCFGGCRDNQYSYESVIAGKRHGVLTYCFVEAARKSEQLNYKEFFRKVVTRVRDIGTPQTPQLSYREGAAPEGAIFGGAKEVPEHPEKKPIVDESESGMFSSCAVQ
jgi:hypothetical protein